MALTTPDESYASVAEVDAYWSARNNSTWAAASTGDKEKALRQATEFIDGKFYGRWIGGHPGSNSQRRAWPRNGAYDAERRVWTGIPVFLKDATARLALDLLETPPEEAEDRGGRIASASAGPVSVEYEQGAPAGRTFPYLNTLLRPLLRAQPRRLVRV